MKNNIIDKFSFSRSSMKKYAEKLITQGVIIVDPSRIDIRGKLICGKNVTIDINVIFEGDVTLEDGVRIGANCIINNSFIGINSNIKPFSMVEDSIIGEKVFIGPYGRIRPGTKIEDKSQIGNFVEIKNSNIGVGCQVNHLSFIGDADIAKEVIVGAGTITCNHNGEKINRIIIDKGAYIGSGSNLVAPIKINANSTIGAGSTITNDTPKDTLTVARSRQVTIKDWKRGRGQN
jgi:bifunctional UDP-N-acetylglucosamine pyrophosphorylase/glucosamine-1-phosphate N-acetyltransferase